MSDDEYDLDDGSLEQYKQRSVDDVLEGREPYEIAENLRGLYHERDWSQGEIADFYDVDQSTISRAMNDADIETRPPMHQRTPSISKSVREDGTTQYHVPDGDGGRDRVYRHQLVALLATDHSGGWAFSSSEVFAEGTHVHHEMASPVALDIPENLDVLSVREHVQLHASGDTKHPELILAEMLGNAKESSVDRHKVERLKRARSRFDGVANAD